MGQVLEESISKSRLFIRNVLFVTIHFRTSEVKYLLLQVVKRGGGGGNTIKYHFRTIKD